MPRCTHHSMLPLLLAFLAPAAIAEPDAGVAPPRRLTAHARPTKVDLGEHFALELVVTHDKTQRYELVPPSTMDDFDFVSVKRDRVDGAGSSTTTFTITLAAYALGALQTPPLKLEVSEAGQTTTLDTPRAAIEVKGQLADAGQGDSKLYEVQPPVEVLVRTWRLVYGLLALMLAAALTFFIVRRLRRPKPVVTAAPKPLEPLHVRTAKALDALAQEQLPSEGRVKEYYFRLSEIVRSYLGERYGFDALESTTPELLTHLRSRNTPGLPLEQLATFANTSDFVRYAKGTSTEDECHEMLQLSYRIVQQTSASAAPPQSTPINGPQSTP